MLWLPSSASWMRGRVPCSNAAKGGSSEYVSNRQLKAKAFFEYRGQKGKGSGKGKKAKGKGAGKSSGSNSGWGGGWD